MAQFFTSVAPSIPDTRKRDSERFGCLKSILDRHLDLFVFLEAKMQATTVRPF